MNQIEIGDRFIGSGSPVFIIAEIGINHQGDKEIAKALIRSAKDSGADLTPALAAKGKGGKAKGKGDKGKGKKVTYKIHALC